MRKKVILAIWLFAGLAVHILMEMGARRLGNGEPYIAEIAYMTLLTFPFGLIVPFLWTGILGLLRNTDLGLFLESNATLTNSLTWITYIGLGYIQWFVLLPILIARFRKRKGSRKI